MPVARPFWGYFTPKSCGSFVHSAAYYSRYMAFFVCAYAVMAKQSHMRNNLTEEAEDAWDRIDRKAFVALPDGRMAQVHPRVDVRIRPSDIWYTVRETLSPIP